MPSAGRVDVMAWAGSVDAAIFALSCALVGRALLGFVLEDGYFFALVALTAVAGASTEAASLFKSCNLAFFVLPI